MVRIMIRVRGRVSVSISASVGIWVSPSVSVRVRIAIRVKWLGLAPVCAFVSGLPIALAPGALLLVRESQKLSALALCVCK